MALKRQNSDLAGVRVVCNNELGHGRSIKYVYANQGHEGESPQQAGTGAKTKYPRQPVGGTPALWFYRAKAISARLAATMAAAAAGKTLPKTTLAAASVSAWITAEGKTRVQVGVGGRR